MVWLVLAAGNALSFVLEHSFHRLSCGRVRAAAIYSDVLPALLLPRREDREGLPDQ
ncbi:hypothetical protein [Modestobacter sp. DSM 44400]|uniref:hypothetical protein n=1 Tax=Modestobacter sp. DSM 44400 TaxID=1550230 RepID=UPI000ACE845B|nr:hypothetical protein [Modestobacter sp. DSM 44400]